jgi:hypothetical protein
MLCDISGGIALGVMRGYSEYRNLRILFTVKLINGRKTAYF